MEIKSHLNTMKRVWFNHRGGYIYKTVYTPQTNKYITYKLPWNQPNISKQV